MLDPIAAGSSLHLQALRASTHQGTGLGTPALTVAGDLSQALMLEHEDRLDSLRNSTDTQQVDTFYEVTIASVDQPKLLSRLSEALVRPASRFTCPHAVCSRRLPQGRKHDCHLRCSCAECRVCTAGRPEPQHCGGARLQHHRQVLPGCLRGQRLDRAGAEHFLAQETHMHVATATPRLVAGQQTCLMLVSEAPCKLPCCMPTLTSFLITPAGHGGFGGGAEPAAAGAAAAPRRGLRARQRPGQPAHAVRRDALPHRL
jgi:hypothetical protein